MPHPTLPPALRVPAASASGTVRMDQFGLTIVHLEPCVFASRPPTPLHFSELKPPHPGSLAASNPSRHAVGLTIGHIVVGGMSDRAVAAPGILPPGANAIVPAEPLSARWPAGPLARWRPARSSRRR